MIDMATVVMGLSFLAAFLAVFGANLVMTDLYERGRRRRIQAMEEELAVRTRERAREVAHEQQAQRTADTSLGRLADEAFKEQAEQESFSERFSAMIEQAGMQVGMARIIATSVGAGLVISAGVGFMTSSWVYAILTGAVAVPLPTFYILYKRNQRIENLRAQLPDGMELMSRVLRAGQTITQAMHAVADEFRGPLAYEFGFCYEQQNLGLSTEFALRDLAKRTGLLEVKIFVLALLVHRQTGGNLTELLDKLAHIIRERFRIQGKIKALTAEGRMQAAILLALPPFMYGVLLLISRQYALELLQHPNLILGAVISMGFGALWIRRIVNFDF